jgi:putative oxygen-independent coproporphyrinogen III oxidase
MFVKGQPVDEYLESLKKEMYLALEKYPTKKLSTIFVGGGTPTALNESQLEKLCLSIKEILPFDEADIEYTFEANPGDLSDEKLQILYSLGVNRLSFGVQSFNEELLHKIGRTHKPKDVYESIEKAEKAGFSNISIDLIYGLPGQTLKDFEETLQKALVLDLPHYSGYSLIVEPKTVFYNLQQKGNLSLPPQETEAAMYELLMEQMDKKGLFQYEISNFAKPGFESKHNLTYWNNDQYFGFGAGAHGYIGNTRVANFGPLKKYMDPINQGMLPFINVHEVTLIEKMEEEMFLGLRKVEGVSIEEFCRKFDKSPFDLFEKQINELTEKRLLKVDEDTISLTKQGKLLGNEVFQEFIGVL